MAWKLASKLEMKRPVGDEIQKRAASEESKDAAPHSSKSREPKYQETKTQMMMAEEIMQAFEELELPELKNDPTIPICVILENEKCRYKYVRELFKDVVKEGDFKWLP